MEKKGDGRVALLFPGDKGWWSSWPRDPTTWLLLAAFALAYFVDGTKS